MATEADAWTASSVQNASNTANQIIKTGRRPKPAYNISQGDIDALIDNSKQQTGERLYQVSPRSNHAYYDNNSITERGDIASIKLINSNNSLEGLSNTSKRFDSSKIPDKSIYNDLIGISNKQRGYDRFLLTDFSVSYSEKTQIMTTFGDNEVVYYFGKNPVIINLSGVLVDSCTR